MVFKLRYSFSLLALAAVFAGCRKDEPQPASTDPVFHAAGTVGGVPFSLSAGVNDYYMYSSYTSDAMDVYEFRGALRPAACTSCPESFTVRMRDYATHTSQQTDISIALAPGFYSFVSGMTMVSTTVSFFSEMAHSSSYSCAWNFGDNTTATVPDPVHTYALPGTYYVCLTATDTALFCTSSICDTIEVGNPCMKADFTATPSGPDSLIFNATITGGTAPYTYAWTYGDSNNGTGNPSVHEYTSGTYLARLVVTDASSCYAMRRRNVQTASDTSCMANFTWQQQTAASTDFSKVIVEWTDANGNVYTSNDPQQPAASTFELVSVEEYQLNENQQRTKKVHLRVTCTLYNGTNTLLLEDADLVFALAYP